MTTIQVENISDVRKKVIFEVPQEKVTEMIDAEYRDLKKSVQIKGFRKGKAPLSIIRNYFKEKVEADASRRIIEETFEPSLQENQITLVSVVKIEPEKVQEDKPFKYVAEIEVPPPVDVKDYKGLQLTKRVRRFDEDLVNKRLEDLRERQAKLSPLSEDGTIKNGDYLVVDISASVEGKPVPALTVVDYHLEVGRNFYLPGFDSTFEGMKQGESTSATFTLPEDFVPSALVGKTGDFEVTIKDAKERIKPALDDDFAKDLGEFESLEALKDSIRKDIQESLEAETKRELENQIVDSLIERHPLQVPEAMVERQIDGIVERGRMNLISMGIDAGRLPPVTQAQRDQVRPSAERNVKAGLILKAIGEKEQVEVSDEELQAEIETRAKTMGYSVDYLKDQLEARNLLQEVKSMVLQAKVFDFLKEHANMTEEEVAPDEASSEEERGKE